MSGWRSGITAICLALVWISVDSVAIGAPTSSGRAIASLADVMTCDSVRAPDYPTLAAAPRACDLGLRQSIYDVKQIRGTRQSIYLRGLRWMGWGSSHAHALGHEECSKLDGGPPDGITNCVSVTVTVSQPRVVLSDGPAPIYQLIRIESHVRTVRVVKTLYCNAEYLCSGEPAPSGYDPQLKCTWELTGYSESLGDAEDSCVGHPIARGVYYYEPGTDALANPPGTHVEPFHT